MSFDPATMVCITCEWNHRITWQTEFLECPTQWRWKLLGPNKTENLQLEQTYWPLFWMLWKALTCVPAQCHSSQVAYFWAAKLNTGPEKMSAAWQVPPPGKWPHSKNAAWFYCYIVFFKVSSGQEIFFFSPEFNNFASVWTVHCGLSMVGPSFSSSHLTFWSDWPKLLAANWRQCTMLLLGSVSHIAGFLWVCMWPQAWTKWGEGRCVQWFCSL
jgi:hypothetical protein